MPSICDILEEAGFDMWSDAEQYTLSMLMQNLVSRAPNGRVISGASDKVYETYIKILDTHLPPNTSEE